MQDHTFTLIISAVGIGGALSGIVIGHFLTRSSQHKQWLRDCRRQEYRELLTALSVTYLGVVQPGTTSQQSNDPQKAARASIEGFKTLHDRIFIAEEIKSARIMGKWLTVLDLYNTPGGLAESMNGFTALKNDLVNMALKEPTSFGFVARLRWWKHKRAQV